MYEVQHIDRDKNTKKNLNIALFTLALRKEYGDVQMPLIKSNHTKKHKSFYKDAATLENLQDMLENN